LLLVLTILYMFKKGVVMLSSFYHRTVLKDNSILQSPCATE